MPKLLSNILKGKKSSEIEKGSTGKNPGVDYKPKAGDEQKFVAKHKTEKHEGRAGNGPDVYAGGKTKEADFPKQSQDAYEEVEQIDELSPATLSSYEGKAITRKFQNARDQGNIEVSSHPAGWNLYKDIAKDTAKREKGLAMANKKLAKANKKSANEEVEELDEISKAKAGAYLSASEKKQKEIMGGKGGSGELVKRMRGAATARSKLGMQTGSNRGGYGKSAAVYKQPRVPATEEVEQVDEVLTKKSPAGEWIKDFVDSDNPKFAGKSKDKRKQMALAAYYAKQRSESVSEAKDSDDTDDEISMVATELRAICADAQDLLNKMPKNMHIEPWVQSKVAVAKSMISGVRDYMLNKTANEEHVHESEEVLPPKNKKLITEKSKCGKCGGSKFKPKGKSMVCESCDTPINMSRSGGEGEPNKVAAYNLDVARV